MNPLLPMIHLLLRIGGSHILRREAVEIEASSRHGCPCLQHVPSKLPTPRTLKAGDICPSCGSPLHERGADLICLQCDENWLRSLPPSGFRALWDDDSLYLNNLWVGSVWPDAAEGRFVTWLRGRGDGKACDTLAEAQTALIERAGQEIVNAC